MLKKMFTSVSCAVLVLLINIHSSFADNDDPTLVTLPYGQIKGHVLQTKNGNYYNAFQEVPYAAPPINRLRYKEPAAPSKWYGILDTTKNTRICYQVDSPYAAAGFTMSEDCLYLNVYTPSNATDLLPVIVWIHGGSYEYGDGTNSSYGPQFLIDYDIAVVTINYRLGALGFLTTEDGVIPGNLGLKDQNLALQWVKQNIRLFGGDPEKITIGGSSSGGVSVGMQLISKKSEGLFRAAILQSGTSITPFARQPFSRDIAFEVGRRLVPSFTSDNSTELLELLQGLPATNIVNSGVISPWQSNSDFPTWGPVIEDENYEGAFITGAMHEDIKNGNINQVPIIISFCSEEDLTFIASGPLALNHLSLLKEQGIIYDNDLSTVVDVIFNITDEDKYKAGYELRNIYTNGTFEDDVGALIRFTSDYGFTTPIIRHAELQSQYTDVYLYQFSYSGLLSNILTTGDEPLDIEGIGPNAVGHGGDTFFFWNNAINTDMSTFPARDRLVQSYLLKLWTNFIKYLNPTPTEDTSIHNLIWPKVTPDRINYLNVDSTLSIQTNPKEYKKWKEILDKYALPPLIVY